MACVRQTMHVAEALESGDYGRAIKLRGGSFRETLTVLGTMGHSPETTASGRRIAHPGDERGRPRRA